MPTNFHLAPPPKTVDGLLAVPIDIQSIEAVFTFDGSTEFAAGREQPAGRRMVGRSEAAIRLRALRPEQGTLRRGVAARQPDLRPVQHQPGNPDHQHHGRSCRHHQRRPDQPGSEPLADRLSPSVLRRLAALGSESRGHVDSAERYRFAAGVGEDRDHRGMEAPIEHGGPRRTNQQHQEPARGERERLRAVPPRGAVTSPSSTGLAAWSTRAERPSRRARSRTKPFTAGLPGESILPPRRMAGGMKGLQRFTTTGQTTPFLRESRLQPREKIQARILEDGLPAWADQA